MKLIGIIILVFLFYQIITVSSFRSALAIDKHANSFANATKYVLTKTWGSHGNENGEFNRPHDMDFSPSYDKLYVVDRDNNRIQVFDKNGVFQFKWGTHGSRDGQLNLPYGIDVDRDGNVWIADRNNSRIQKFDPRGNFLLKFGSNGSGDGQFNNLRHVAVDKALKYVYVADSVNHRIQKFDTKGDFVKSFGSFGSKFGQLNIPTTVVIDSNGDLYVNERGNERIQKFDADGNPILMWGSKGTGPYQFCHIEHIDIDKFDNIYVTDPQSDPGCNHEPMVKKFDSKGRFISEWKVEGTGTDIDPEHLAVDLQGNVYVSERNHDKIQVYHPLE